MRSLSAGRGAFSIKRRTGAFAENRNSIGTCLLPIVIFSALLLDMSGLIGHHD